MSDLGTSVLRRCAALATRRPWAILSVALLLTIAAGYLSSRLTLDTSTEGILSAELPFRQVEARYRAAFPDEELALVVVDGATADAAEAAATDLVTRLRDRPDLLTHVALLGSSAYLDRYGLLFLSPDRIEALGERVRPARGLLTTLAADPSLRGLATLLKQGEGAVGEGATPRQLAGFLANLATTVERRAAGEPARVGWRAMLALEAGTNGARRLVQAKPVLDNTSLDRAGPALDGARRGEIAAVTRRDDRESRCASPASRCCGSRS